MNRTARYLVLALASYGLTACGDRALLVGTSVNAGAGGSIAESGASGSGGVLNDNGGASGVGGVDQSAGAAGSGTAGAGMSCTDDDCGRFVCARSFGAANQDVYVTSIAVAGSGFVVVTGQFTGSVDFGGTTLTSVGDADIFLAKYATDCSLSFAESFGTPLLDGGLTVAVADNLDIVLGGFFGQPNSLAVPPADIDFGGKNMAGNGLLTAFGGGDAFLVRFDQDGGHLWSHAYGSAPSSTSLGRDYIRALDIAPNTDILVTGEGSGAFCDHNGTIKEICNDVTEGAVVARYTPEGRHEWTESLQPGVPGPIAASGFGIAVTPDDQVFVSGAYDGGALYQGLVFHNLNTAFLANLSNSGSTTWLKSLRTKYPAQASDTSDDNFGNSVAVSASATVWGGHVVGPVDFGAGERPGFGSWDAFLISYDAAGTLAHGLVQGGPAADQVSQLALDPQGNILLVGTLAGPGSNSAGGALAKYSSGGSPLWSHAFGENSNARAIAWAAPYIAIAGDFESDADLGDRPRTALGRNDGFVALFRE